MVNRRTFLKSGLAGTLALGAGAFSIYSMQDTTSDFELTHIPVYLERLPREFRNYRVGFISDIHFGKHFLHEWVEQALGLFQNEPVDVLLLGGDYLWIPDNITGQSLERVRNRNFLHTSKKELSRAIYRAFADLAGSVSTRDGTFGVFGNHDRWIDPQGCTLEFQRKGIQILVNQKVEIYRGQGKLEIFGADDYWTGIPDLQALSPRPAGEQSARLLLSHNPDLVSYASYQANVDFDLSLSGHTHGGQILLPLLGAVRDNIVDNRLFEGLVDLGTCQAFTSRGVGVVEIPYRFNCRPEVSVLELLPA